MSNHQYSLPSMKIVTVICINTAQATSGRIVSAQVQPSMSIVILISFASSASTNDRLMIVYHRRMSALVVKYLALTYGAQLEVSQAGKLMRRIIFEHRHRDRQRLICSHTCWWLLMICTMSRQWRISCIWLSALIPGCELINHRPTISSCLRAMITACFQHLAGHLTGRSFDWLIVLSNNYLAFFDQVINPCRTFSSGFLWMLPTFG